MNVGKKKIKKKQKGKFLISIYLDLEVKEDY